MFACANPKPMTAGISHAVGIDVGGTKIETRVFDENWAEVRRQRVDTPSQYEELLQVIADQIAQTADADSPIGIGTAGLVHPEQGLLTAANLAAHGHRFGDDIAAAAGRRTHVLNDARAFGLSEAIFGAGRGHRTTAALILGTGIGGALIIDGKIPDGPTKTGGEFGHTAAPAHLVAKHNLPIFDCGCGRKGCIETYISGRGLTRMAQGMTGQDVPPQAIVAARASDFALVWAAWYDLMAELIIGLTLTVDPDVIVLGGGLSAIDGLPADLHKAATQAQIAGFGVPPIVLAEGGDASGARGAAYAAWQKHE